MNLEDLKSNINKFSFSQLVSNNDGKTSGSGFVGVIVTLAGTLAFLYGCVDFSLISGKNDIMMYSGGIITVGTGLLGVRKMKTDKSMSDEAETISKINQTETSVQ